MLELRSSEPRASRSLPGNAQETWLLDGLAQSIVDRGYRPPVDGDVPATWPAGRDGIDGVHETIDMFGRGGQAHRRPDRVAGAVLDVATGRAEKVANQRLGAERTVPDADAVLG